jgi:hypothetical protein
MWRCNPTWGQKVISAELAKPGYNGGSRTVAKYRPSSLDRQRGQRWATFIRNHLPEIWACDFFILVTGRFRVLYVFVVLSLGRRRIVCAAVTDHSSASWAAQSIVEATSDALRPPRFLIHDRDSIYGADFWHRVGGLGTRLLATPSAGPNPGSARSCPTASPSSTQSPPPRRRNLELPIRNRQSCPRISVPVPLTGAAFSRPAVDRLRYTEVPQAGI